MQTGQRLAPLLWLLAAPLVAQNGPSPARPAPMTMPMAPTAPMAMEHSSPPQSPAPLPDLLQGVAARAPRKLEDFLAMADRNNPTLQQVAAIIRRSQAEAKQAALYPNPTVGYEGDQIRGGSYGGGEQGGFIAQTIVLGGKLGLRRNIYEQQKQSDTMTAEAQLAGHVDGAAQSLHALPDRKSVV